MISNVSTENQGLPAGGTADPVKAVPKLAQATPAGTLHSREACALFSRVSPILDKHGRKPSRLVPILQEVQAEYRYLPREVLSFVARSLNIAPARVFGIATFYAHFAINPKGKHLVRLCDGTACHVKDSIPILDAIRKKLGVTAKNPTTADLQFTVETVACLGACGLAPVVVIDEQVHGAMTPEKALAAIDAVIAADQEGTP